MISVYHLISFIYMGIKYVYTSIIFFSFLFFQFHMCCYLSSLSYLHLYPENFTKNYFNYLHAALDNKIPKYEFSPFFLLLISLRCFVILIPLRSSLAGALLLKINLVPWVMMWDNLMFSHI